MKKNENMLYFKMWDTVNTVLKRKCIAQNAYLRNEERFQINNLSSYLKKPEE